MMVGMWRLPPCCWATATSSTVGMGSWYSERETSQDWSLVSKSFRTRVLRTTI